MILQKLVILDKHSLGKKDIGYVHRNGGSLNPRYICEARFLVENHIGMQVIRMCELSNK